jgi:predicted  nucleic acid-binding Zn-ribbon protein
MDDDIEALCGEALAIVRESETAGAALAGTRGRADALEQELERLVEERSRAADAVPAALLAEYEAARKENRSASLGVPRHVPK